MVEVKTAVARGVAAERAVVRAQEMGEEGVGAGTAGWARVGAVVGLKEAAVAARAGVEAVGALVVGSVAVSAAVRVGVAAVAAAKEGMAVELGAAAPVEALAAASGPAAAWAAARAAARAAAWAAVEVEAAMALAVGKEPAPEVVEPGLASTAAAETALVARAREALVAASARKAESLGLALVAQAGPSGAAAAGAALRPRRSGCQGRSADRQG
jgi:hypothetical protein